MKLFGKDLRSQTVYIAEIGVNHEGDIDKALELIDLAAGAGADAVKFQSYTPDRYILTKDRERFDRVTRFGLSEAHHRALAERAMQRSVSFFSSALSEDWVQLIAELSEAIKIASGDLNFEPTVRAAAGTGRKLIISTGAGTMEDVDTCIQWVAEETGQENLAERLVLLHCISAYPTPIEDTNLASIPFMRARYGMEVGFSNHIVGIDACLGAIALGATVIEAHFTDKKEGRTFHDHTLSCNPSDFSELVERGDRIRAAIGRYGKAIAPSEAPNRSAIRKGIIAARDIKSGHAITLDDVKFARPEGEVPSSRLSAVVGKTVGRALRAGEPLPRSILSD